MNTGPTPAGEDGIARAQRSAENARPGWTEDAAGAIRLFARTVSEFTIEEARTHVQIEDPPELRAWGAATQLAQRRKWIERTGAYRQASSSNGSEKPVYRRGPNA